MYQAFEAIKNKEGPKESKESHKDNFERLENIA